MDDEICNLGILIEDTMLMPLNNLAIPRRVPKGTLLLIQRISSMCAKEDIVKIENSLNEDRFQKIMNYPFKCDKSVIRILSPLLFSMLMPVKDYIRRLDFAIGIRPINHIKESEFVYFSYKNDNITCRIHDIRMIPEKGRGTFICIETLEYHWPELLEKTHILKKYMDDRNPYQSAIVTIDQLYSYDNNLNRNNLLNHNNQIGIGSTQPIEIKQKINEDLSTVDLIRGHSVSPVKTYHTEQNGISNQNIVSIMKPNIPGILKNSKQNKSDKSTASPTSKQIQLNSFFVNGKEIVILDSEFVRESTKNQNDVTVIKKGDHMEFANALGKNWPPEAGAAAEILNNDKTNVTYSHAHAGSSASSSSSHSIERNKSPNLYYHIANKKVNKNEKSFGHYSAVASTTGKKCGNDSSSRLLGIHSYGAIEENKLESLPQIEISESIAGIGTMIEVSTEVCDNLYGVVKWIGIPTGTDQLMVGVELEEEIIDHPIDLTNGSFKGRRYFNCPNGRGIFVEPKYCSLDRRFDSDHLTNDIKITSENARQTFGEQDCPIVEGKVSPLNHNDFNKIVGSFKGIQGHHNSCYLDATLFAMFTFTHVFDSMLFRLPQIEDNPRYAEVQNILRDQIVNPLRQNQFVRADRVLNLREILEEIALVTGLTNEEKDPEEFLNILLAQVMRLEPLLKLNSGQDAYYYQLFVEKDNAINFPTVQQLFEQSFFTSNIKLKEVPSCFIVQMPRFGKDYKVYSRILPSQVLDVTDIIENSPRQCTICSKLADHECRKCFYEFDGGLESTTYCSNCVTASHKHERRLNHSFDQVNPPQDFILGDTVPRIFMELFAVVCIETSHYVTFVKSGPGVNAPWCFFDSMADRIGGKNGYNIPKVISVPDMSTWLTEDGFKKLNEEWYNEKLLPDFAKRLLCDAYMCMYQAVDMMMYK